MHACDAWARACTHRPVPCLLIMSVLAVCMLQACMHVMHVHVLAHRSVRCLLIMSVLAVCMLQACMHVMHGHVHAHTGLCLVYS